MRMEGPVIPGAKPELRHETDFGQPLGQEILFTATSQAEITLTVQAHVDEAGGANNPASNAKKQTSKLQASLGLPTVQDALRTAGMAMIEQLPVRDISGVFNGKWLNRSVFEVRLRIATEMTEKTGYIETVDVTYDPTL
jgi:hypothetical protein